MSLRRVLGGRAGQGGGSRSMTALDEKNALQDAQTSAALIMNDEVERAETELAKGTSPFHRLGRATALFLRATLGFEKEIMEQAAARIAEAEESAIEYQRRAIRDRSTAHQSAIYPPGAEYALCHAETQLMSAVVAVLTESLTESLRGFYKMRKAFNTLYEISEAEKKYLQKHGKRTNKPSVSASSSTSTLPNDSSTNSSNTPTGSSGVQTPTTDDDDEDDLDFEDAQYSTSNPTTPIFYQGNLEYPGMTGVAFDKSITEKVAHNVSTSKSVPGIQVDSRSAAEEADLEPDILNITSDPIDLFIHSGTNLCFGLLQLMLSLVPPAFSRILSIFSFRGNREAGIRMLWTATKFKKDINGAMAGLITLGFHNAAIGTMDIIPKDALPEARLRSLLYEMREIYPRSKLWLLEESRMYAMQRQLEKGIDLISNGPKSSLKQIEALGLFEMSLGLMYLHRYQECADSFIKCVGLNNWSHALYYYIAGVCHVELYRLNKTEIPEKAKEHASKAEKYLYEVRAHVGKRKFMARQLPFDVFVGRKITKWESRAKNWNCSFVDAVGVSPVVEMTYFWSGFRRMSEKDFKTSLERLAWSEDSEKNPYWSRNSADEQAVLNLLRGVCARCLGHTDQARATLTSHVISLDLHKLKAVENADTWPLPVAHYELAVCYWEEAGGEGGSQSLLEKCSEELAIVEQWESFELEARVGMKVSTARQTLRKAGIGP